MPRRASPKQGRTRRRAGLVLLALGLLFTAAMVVSAWCWFGYSTSSWLADVGDGTLYTRAITPNGWQRPLHGWHHGPNGKYYGKSWEWTWWAFGETNVYGEVIHAHSIWPLAPLTLLTGATLYLSGRRALNRAARNQCLSCGYSRTGIPTAAPCPECGLTPALSTPPKVGDC